MNLTDYEKGVYDGRQAADTSREIDRYIVAVLVIAVFLIGLAI